MPSGRLKAEQRQRDAQAEQFKKLNERGVPVAREGVVVGGSWRAQESSVEVIFCDTYASQLDDPNIGPINHPRVPLWTMQPTDAYGPVGGERVHLIPTQSGYAAILQGGVPVMPTGIDGSNPDVPSGERWIAHRNAAGEIDAFFKQTNDGPTTGDGLGGSWRNGGALNVSSTSGGNETVMDDTNRFIQTTTTDGMLARYDDVLQKITIQAAMAIKSVIDAANGSISQVAPGVGLGDLWQNLDSAGYGAINQSILSTFGGNINAANLQTLINHCQAMIDASIPNAKNLLPLIVASLIDNVKIPAGSSVVRMLS